MRIGLTVQATTIDELIDEAGAAAQLGFHSLWRGGSFPLDTLTALAVVGREVPDVELGTAVVPTYPRHPLALAVQAQTVHAATGGRLLLGIGPSHQVFVEETLGYSYAKPAQHVRAYLSALVPLLRTGVADYRGPGVTTVISTSIALASPQPPMPILVSALAPRMLHIAGELADGTITFMAGARTLAEHIVPSITAAATAAGRPRPRVIASVPVCVTDDADDARNRAAPMLVKYGERPVFRAMLDHEGLTHPVDLAIIGDENTLSRQLRRLSEAGATEIIASPVGSPDERQQTIEVLGAIAANRP